MNTVTKSGEHSRFEITVDGVEAGFADFHDHGTTRDFPHTVVHEQFQGRGISKELIKEALDQTRAEGMQVVPTCPAVAGFISKNPEYADLLADQSGIHAHNRRD